MTTVNMTRLWAPKKLGRVLFDNPTVYEGTVVLVCHFTKLKM